MSRRSLNLLSHKSHPLFPFPNLFLFLFLFLFSGDVHSQCCCGDLEFNVILPKGKKDGKTEVLKARAHYYDEIYRLDDESISYQEDGIITVANDTGCGYPTMYFDIPFNDRLMRIHFTDVPGDITLRFGSVNWQEGEFEIHLPDFTVDDNGRFLHSEQLLQIDLESHMFRTPMSVWSSLFLNPFPRLVGGQLDISEIVWKPVINDLKHHGVAILAVEQWTKESGWQAVGPLILDANKSSVGWEYDAKGRFRFVFAAERNEHRKWKLENVYSRSFQLE